MFVYLTSWFLRLDACAFAFDLFSRALPQGKLITIYYCLGFDARRAPRGICAASCVLLIVTLVVLVVIVVAGNGAALLLLVCLFWEWVDSGSRIYMYFIFMLVSSSSVFLRCVSLITTMLWFAFATLNLRPDALYWIMIRQTTTLRACLYSAAYQPILFVFLFNVFNAFSVAEPFLGALRLCLLYVAVFVCWGYTCHMLAFIISYGWVLATLFVFCINGVDFVWVVVLSSCMLSLWFFCKS